MNIPSNFKKAIRNNFYDKELTIKTTTIEQEIDEEGAVIEGKKDIVKETIMGNFQYSTLEKIQQQYGKEIIAECITTCEDTRSNNGRYFSIS